VTIVGDRVTTGVVVLGMHRSGTSATTRAINLLGIPLCVQEDLWLGSRGNPTGYWESASLAQFNDRLLREAGAAWWCPPASDELTPLLGSEPLRAAASALFARLHTTDQWVWKDPRICITLPFWREVLDAMLTCILVLRNPLEIAESLRVRDGMPLRWGLALWERYSRHALQALDGHDVIVTQYADVVGDAVGWARRTSSQLSDRGLILDTDRRQAADFLREELRHGVFDEAAVQASPEVTPEQRELYELMHALDTTDEHLAVPGLPAESPYVDELFLTLRQDFDIGRFPRLEAVEALLTAPSTRAGGAMSTIETNHEAGTGMISPEWQHWIAENLMLGFPRDEIAEVMASAGLPPDLALDAIALVETDPCWHAGDQVAQRLRKLESLLDILQELDQLDGAAERLDRVTCPSQREFLERYYARNRPVLIEGLADGWSARDEWTPERLKARIGHVEVEVQTGRDNDELYELRSDWHKRVMTFGEFVDRITVAGAGNDLYLTANNHFFERADTATLLSDFTPPAEYLDPAAQPGTMFLWFGPAGTITPLHHDVVNVLFVQVQGRKRITLIPAREMPRVYNGVGVYSEVDATNPDLARFPRYAEATRLEVVLQPGESLFIPVGWFHTVEALDLSVSLSFTGFVFPNSYSWQHPEHAF
jgi:Cupin-like domain